MNRGNKGKDCGKKNNSDSSLSSKPEPTLKPIGKPVDVSDTDFGLFQSLTTKEKKPTNIS